MVVYCFFLRDPVGRVWNGSGLVKHSKYLREIYLLTRKEHNQQVPAPTASHSRRKRRRVSLSVAQHAVCGLDQEACDSISNEATDCIDGSIDIDIDKDDGDTWVAQLSDCVFQTYSSMPCDDDDEVHLLHAFSTELPTHVMHFVLALYTNGQQADPRILPRVPRVADVARILDHLGLDLHVVFDKILVDSVTWQVELPQLLTTLDQYGGRVPVSWVDKVLDQFQQRDGHIEPFKLRLCPKELRSCLTQIEKPYKSVWALYFMQRAYDRHEYSNAHNVPFLSPEHWAAQLRLFRLAVSTKADVSLGDLSQHSNNCNVSSDTSLDLNIISRLRTQYFPPRGFESRTHRRMLYPLMNPDDDFTWVQRRQCQETDFVMPENLTNSTTLLSSIALAPSTSPTLSTLPIPSSLPTPSTPTAPLTSLAFMHSRDTLLVALDTLLYNKSRQLLEHLLFPREFITIAGGAAVALVCGNSFVTNDVDFFVTGNDAPTVIANGKAALRAVLQTYGVHNIRTTTFLNIITVWIRGSRFPLQFILQQVATCEELLHHFDLSICQIGLVCNPASEYELVFTPASLLSLATGCVTLSTHAQALALRNQLRQRTLRRMHKYVQRNFSVFAPTQFTNQWRVTDPSAQKNDVIPNELQDTVQTTHIQSSVESPTCSSSSSSTSGSGNGYSCCSANNSNSIEGSSITMINNPSIVVDPSPPWAQSLDEITREIRKHYCDPSLIVYEWPDHIAITDDEVIDTCFRSINHAHVQGQVNIWSGGRSDDDEPDEGEQQEMLGTAQAAEVNDAAGVSVEQKNQMPRISRIICAGYHISDIVPNVFDAPDAPPMCLRFCNDRFFRVVSPCVFHLHVDAKFNNPFALSDVWSVQFQHQNLFTSIRVMLQHVVNELNQIADVPVLGGPTEAVKLHGGVRLARAWSKDYNIQHNQVVLKIHRNKSSSTRIYHNRLHLDATQVGRFLALACERDTCKVQLVVSLGLVRTPPGVFPAYLLRTQLDEVHV